MNTVLRAWRSWVVPLARDIGLDPAPAVRHLAIGAAVAAALISLSIGIFAVNGWYRVRTVHLDVGGFAYALVLFSAVALAEEILSRGLIWRALERRFGVWVALAGSALFFGLAHFANPGATLASGLAIAAHAGLLFGAMLIVTRSLWVPIGAHVAWNLFEGPVYGTPVSGLDTGVLIDATVRGPAIWTGGAFGPEAGLVTVTLGVGAAVALLVYAVKTGRTAATPATTPTGPIAPDRSTNPGPHAPGP